MNEIKQHKRVNDILLGPLERPALQWLAAHMPAWVTPDFCTIIGTLGALLTLFSYGLSNIDPNYLWLASWLATVTLNVRDMDIILIIRLMWFVR